LVLKLPDGFDILQVHEGDAITRNWMQILSEEERLRLTSFPVPKRQREFTLGRIAARVLLGHRLAISPERVPLRVADDGAVEVLSPNLVLSIAHSGDRAVAGIADRKIGVDIEIIRQRNPRLIRYILNPAEEHFFYALPLDDNRRLVLAWTIKEAVLKAKRTGLRVSPKKLRIAVNPGDSSAEVMDIEGKRWQVQFEEQDKYYLAVAFE